MTSEPQIETINWLIDEIRESETYDNTTGIEITGNADLDGVEFIDPEFRGMDTAISVDEEAEIKDTSFENLTIESAEVSRHGTIEKLIELRELLEDDPNEHKSQIESIGRWFQDNAPPIYSVIASLDIMKDIL